MARKMGKVFTVKKTRLISVQGSKPRRRFKVRKGQRGCYIYVNDKRVGFKTSSKKSSYKR